MKEYKTKQDLLKSVGVSRQRVHQIFDHYNLGFPEPDAVVGKRSLYLPETMEKFVENFPTRANRNILLEKWKNENPDYSSVSDFIKSRGALTGERKAFSVKVAQLTSAGQITSKQFGKFRIYKTEELERLYDKTYKDVVAFTISRLAEESAKHPDAITLEQFCVAVGLPFSTIVSRYYKSNPRPEFVFRVSGKHFYNYQDLVKILTDKDLKKIKVNLESKMSEGGASV